MPETDDERAERERVEAANKIVEIFNRPPVEITPGQETLFVEPEDAA